MCCVCLPPALKADDLKHSLIQDILNTFTASIFWVFHQFSKVVGEFNSMNIQRRNASSERRRILFSNTTDLFSIAVSKDFPQTILCHQI
jgi:hypothetical protein